MRSRIRSQIPDFTDRFNARISVQRAVAAVIHVVAAIELPVVVFGAAAVDAERHVSINSDGALILSSLVANAWSQCSELSEVAPVELQLGDLLAGDSSSQVGRLGLDLGDVLAFYGYFGAGCTDLQCGIGAVLGPDAQDNAFGLIILETWCSDIQVVG